MDEILTAFIEDGHERLAAMETGLLRMEEGERDADTLNAIFRAAHTIKGDAGVVELLDIERFTHVLENHLDLLRKGALNLDGDLIPLLLEGCDYIKVLFARVERGEQASDPAILADGDDIAERLRCLVEAQSAKPSPEHATSHVEQDASDTPTANRWHISLQFNRDLFRHGMDPIEILRYLDSLGEIISIVPQLELIPDAETMDPESCYIGFELVFCGCVDQSAIEKALEFAREDSTFIITPLSSSESPEAAWQIENLPSLDRQDSAPAKPPAAAIERRRQEGEVRTTEARQVRVQTEKLDQLIDMVGELVIATAGASLQAQKSQQTALTEANAGVAQLVEGIRELALRLRMVKIGETFGRFRRVVRDMARNTGREIELVVRGDETELDKSVVEKIGDPLLHLIRNAIDHGIEPAQVRIAQNKPARGTIGLNAYHDSGGIVIEVADDGAGLDRDKILAKAIEKGLVQESDALSETEIFNLIFEPGFSTADKVTNLSGRGVGMDVVRSNVRALRGSVEASSEAGRGSRFVIRLPLTMAIFDGFLVGAGASMYVIPQEHVVECTQLPTQQASEGRDSNCMNLRGEILPCIRLRELFSLSGKRPRRENVVVVKQGGRKAGIVVDDLHGEIQTVVKPLNNMFQRLRCVAGATIIGTGEVALILDVQGLIQRSIEMDEALLSPPRAAAQP